MHTLNPTLKPSRLPMPQSPETLKAKTEKSLTYKSNHGHLSAEPWPESLKKLGFQSFGLRLRGLQGLGFRVWGSGFRVEASGSSRSRVRGSGLRVEASGSSRSRV